MIAYLCVVDFFNAMKKSFYESGLEGLWSEAKKLDKSPIYAFLWKIDVVKVLDLEFLVISTSRKGNFLSCSLFFHQTTEAQ